MNCLDRELLQKYFDNELNDLDKDKVDNHLKGCNDCRDELNNLSQFKDLLTTTKVDLKAPPFRRKKVNLRYRYFSAAAVVIFIILSLVTPPKENQPQLISYEEGLYEDPNQMFNDGVVLYTIIEDEKEKLDEWEDPLNDPNESFYNGEPNIFIRTEADKATNG